MPDFIYPYDVNNLPPAPPIRLPSDVKRNPSPLWRWLAVITVGFIALNFLLLPIAFMVPSTPPSVIGSIVACLSIGAIGAEPGLLAIAAVFGPGSTWRRQCVVALLVLVLALSGFASFVATKVVYSHRAYFLDISEVLPFTLLLPILFLACQMPLWFFRSLLSWRIANQEQAATEMPPRPSIAGILAATAVVALGLGSVRLGHYLMSQMGQVESQQWWLITGISAAFAAAISMVALPPFTGAIFRTKSPLLGVMGAVAWTLFLFGSAIAIIRWANGGWPVPIPWYPFAANVAGFTMGLLGPLVVVRLFGYRLLWGRKQKISDFSSAQLIER